MLDRAAQRRADLIVFPEMSLTGYTRENAAALAFDVDDARLGPLKSATASHRIIAVAGAPIGLNGALYIGSFILFPDHSQSLYIKQFLHSGEELHFCSSFEHDPLIRSSGENESRWPFARTSTVRTMPAGPATVRPRSTPRASSSPRRGRPKPMIG